MTSAEHIRLATMRSGNAEWRKWGPYLSDRQWGTVREDYSVDGDAWNYFPHDHARSRAYRWGEDGLGGWCDDAARLCLGLALWNGRDPILKERLFGLTNAEGNHGEDVKELYWHLDGLPSHAYMRMLYKYPHVAFPYADLVATNAARGLGDPEYKIGDTGIFADRRYCDVTIEYAKAGPGDTLALFTLRNCGTEATELHVLPHIWFRNTWSWSEDAVRPSLSGSGVGRIDIAHAALPAMVWACDVPGSGAAPPLLFCDNDTNSARVFDHPLPGYFKDGIDQAVVHGNAAAINPRQEGTKAAAHIVLTLAPGEQRTVRVRLRPAAEPGEPFDDFDAIVSARRAEADAFYAVVQKGVVDPQARLVQRQALAGLLWSKQFYAYDVWRWLHGDPAQPMPPNARLDGRNSRWVHLATGVVDPESGGDILLVPDSWEYPWFAAWDMAFHSVTMALIDPDFAKRQLLLLTQARMQHPNGQLPAYEWNLSDVNPPVHAWAALRVYAMDAEQTGIPDTAFLSRVFDKLLLNFTWWVNRQDAEGNNVFEGGFLGLDNISLFDRHMAIPGGGTVEQSDGTSWAATYALNMMRIAIALCRYDRAYEDLATKFFEHFVYIASALHGDGAHGIDGLWDEQDQFYYDVLNVPGEVPIKLRVRSMVGLLPILASEVLREDFDQALPSFMARMRWFVSHRPEYAALVSDWEKPGELGYRQLSMLRKHRLNALLTRMLDEGEFLSPHGVRSVSKFHRDHPYSLIRDGQTFSLSYEPGLGQTRIYGGNSNWRGPVWMPLNFMLIEALRGLGRFYGESFTMALPTGSAHIRTLGQIADELSRRIQTLFLPDADGRRPATANDPLYASDPGLTDLIPFNEFFDGDTGAGLGAAHQTGWTALVALLIDHDARTAADTR